MRTTLLFLAVILGWTNVSAQGVKFSADMSTEPILIDPNGFSTEIPTAYGHIKNLTGDSLLIVYVREQTLPALWNTNVCFGVNCYASFVSTAEAYWAPGEEKSLKVVFNTPPSAIGSANVRVKIFTRGNNDTVAFDLTANAAPWLPLECRSLQLYNDSDVDLVIDRIWLRDSINFSVAPRYPLPTEFYAESSMDYDLCINPRDGKEYTTKVFYSVGAEIRESSVTLTAPSSASVVSRDQEQRLLACSVIKPQSFVIVPAAVGDLKNWTAVVSSASGIQVQAGPLDEAGQLWIAELPVGIYFVQVLANGTVVGTEKLLIQ